ncbi:hypothetical protein D6774_00215 [Candidatus Woesearchaeota archaeon]|nr:MAG: hypothetical protein D6774_00215 [Candidatus Woesearchaeota archaeon]
MKLITILKKNLKIILRNPLSALIIILGPLLLVTLLGFSFGAQTDVLLKASAFSTEYSPLAQETLDTLKATGTQITKVDTLEECIRLVQTGENQLCIEFPPGFSTQGNTQLTFHVDSSQLNLVGYVLDNVKSGVDEKRAAISTTYSADILDRLSFAKQQLELIDRATKTAQEQATNASQDISTSTSQVESINIDFGINSSGISDATENVVNADSTFYDLFNSVETNLASVENDLNDLQSDIEDAIASAQGTAVESELEAINASIATLLEEVKNARNATSSNYTNASVYLADAQITLSSLSSALESLNEQISASISAKSTATESLTRAQESVDALKTSLDTLRSSVSQALERIGSIDLSARQISTPIETRIQAINSSKNNFEGMFPTLIVLITMITSILLAATLTFSEKSSRAHLRTLLTPTSAFTLNMGTFLTAMTLILVQNVLFFAVSTALFKVGLTPNLYLVFLTLIAVSAVFILIGMILGYLFKTQETTMLAAVTLCTLFMFFSNTFVPLATLPKLVQTIAKYSPFVISENIIKQVLVFNLDISAVYTSIGIVLGYIALFYGLFTLIQHSASKMSKVHFAHEHLGFAGRINLASRLKRKKKSHEKSPTTQENTINKKAPLEQTAKVQETTKEVTTTNQHENTASSKPLPPAPKPTSVEDTNLPPAPSPIPEHDLPKPLFIDEEPSPINEETIDEEEPANDFEARLAEINRLLGE